MDGCFAVQVDYEFKPSFDGKCLLLLSLALLAHSLHCIQQSRALVSTVAAAPLSIFALLNTRHFLQQLKEELFASSNLIIIVVDKITFCGYCINLNTVQK